jgi:hypothetical protein
LRTYGLASSATEKGGPHLPSVTLVAVSSISLEATVAALERSMTEVCFGKVLLLSHRAPRDLPASIGWREIEYIGSRSEYSYFMLHELWKYITTDFAMCVQWDGHVLDGGRWKQEFLEYDYIGAPWPHFDQNRIGNGGFSLRSRRLMKATTTVPSHPGEAEDIAICRTHRKRLENDFGLRFAPEQLASEFAYERSIATGREFGFHGIFNMRSRLSRPEFIKLLSSLEAGTIGRSEWREILIQSIGYFDFRAAWLVLRNRLSAPRARSGYS